MTATQKRQERPASATGQAGFAEVSALYGAQSQDGLRLSESIRLQQAFAALESETDRVRIIALAEALAARPR